MLFWLQVLDACETVLIGVCGIDGVSEIAAVDVHGTDLGAFDRIPTGIANPESDRELGNQLQVEARLAPMELGGV